MQFLSLLFCILFEFNLVVYVNKVQNIDLLKDLDPNAAITADVRLKQNHCHVECQRGEADPVELLHH